jgi:hypothetical protein
MSEISTFQKRQPSCSLEPASFIGLCSFLHDVHVVFNLLSHFLIFVELLLRSNFPPFSSSSRSTIKYFCSPPLLKNVCTLTESYSVLSSRLYESLCDFLQCVFMFPLFIVIKLHALHFILSSGALSSSTGNAGCSGSSIVLGSTVENCEK